MGSTTTRDLEWLPNVMRSLLIVLSLTGLLPQQGPEVLWSRGERALAIEALEAQLERGETPAARRQLVEWCFAVHRYRAALDGAAKLGEEGVALEGRALYFLGRYEEALGLLPEDEGEAVLMRIEALRALGREWTEWVDIAGELLGETDERVFGLRGRRCLERGEHEEAALWFEATLEVTPLDAEAMFGLGRALLLGGERVQGLGVLERHREVTPLLDALDFAERGLDLAPTHGANHAAVGDAWRSLVPFDRGSYRRAERSYRKAVKLMSGAERVPVHLRHARLVAEHGRGALEAAKLLDGVLEELVDVRLLVRAADLYLEGGEKWKGVERLERALALKPDDEEIARRLREAGGNE